MGDIRTVCVFAGSSAKVPSAYLQSAYRLGQLLVQQGFHVVYGAGAVGCMGRLADGVLDAGGRLTGVIPEFMVKHGWCRPGLTETRITRGMSERKQLLHELADAVIALPGGIGTYEELTETITWKQLSLINPEVIIFNQDGFYDGFLSQIQRATADNFMGDKETTGRRAEDLFKVASTVDEIIQHLTFNI